MKMKELRVKNAAELRTMLREERAKLGTMRFQVSSGGLKGVRTLREARKTIARLLTLLGAHEREKRQQDHA